MNKIENDKQLNITLKLIKEYEKKLKNNKLNKYQLEAIRSLIEDLEYQVEEYKQLISE